MAYTLPTITLPPLLPCFDRAVALARATGVKLVLRPVLPVLMRGVPATRETDLNADIRVDFTH